MVGQNRKGWKGGEETLARKFHITVLSGKLWKAVCWSTNREGGGGVRVLLLGDLCTKTRQPIAEVLW